MMTNRLVLLFIAVFATLLSNLAVAQFVGELEFIPPDCQAHGACILKNKLRFTDVAGLSWEADAGLTTDGASIPSFFQPFVGKPFDAAFIKAAVIHDHYCVRHVRPWRVTHRVFYEGLLAQGVDKTKAKVMYYAVYLGGPKWVELIPGKKCDGNCVKTITDSNGKPVINFRTADYELFDMELELKQVAASLEKNPESISLEQLEARAKKRRPNDYYYKNGSQVHMSGNGISE
jgi:hypothetical protein